MYLGVSNYGPFKTFVFIVDINGGKGPNKYGYDIFTFTINSDYKLIGGLLIRLITLPGLYIAVMTVAVPATIVLRLYNATVGAFLMITLLRNSKIITLY